LAASRAKRYSFFVLRQLSPGEQILLTECL
jgi:hypothetical protein